MSIPSRLRWTGALALSLWAILIAGMIAAPLQAATDPTYAALRGAKPDGRKVPVHNLVLERDAFRFQLDSGTLHLLAPVQGRTIGAVFVGKGSYRLSPATPYEQRQLALFSGADKGFEALTDTFENLLLFFTDDTLAELERHAAVQTGAPDPHAVDVQGKWLKRQQKDFRTNFHLRILEDLLNTPGRTDGVFVALIDGRRNPPALAAVDPDGAGALRISSRLGGEDTVLWVADADKGGLWYLCDRKDEVARHQPTPEKRLAGALDYRIETEVKRDADLVGQATVRFQTLVEGLRVLPVNLLSKLRIGDASYAVEAAGAEPAWKPLAWVQEDENKDADAVVVFPEPLAKGVTVRLRLAYQGGEVLQNVGGKSFVFGALPQTHVAITQQAQWSFGQSWPSLIFLPYMSFLTSTQRAALGLFRATDFINQVGFHEFAHQWWGHLVGAATYRDEWLEEGFSEFSAALAVQHTQGWGGYTEFWRHARKFIFGKYPGNAIAHDQAGPISQGWRLGTAYSPSAPQAMIYSKGGYVLHMLRTLMWDSKSKTPDANFIAMMKDFTSTYAGKPATTADFQHVVERHMVPALNAAGDGKMDWFFNQWVYGMDVPRYVSDLKVEKAGDEYRIHGQVTQQGVGKTFRALVPVQVEL